MHFDSRPNRMFVYATVNGEEQQILVDPNFGNNLISTYYIDESLAIEKIRIQFRNSIKDAIVLGNIEFLQDNKIDTISPAINPNTNYYGL
ncbi:UNVERIFIED_CONTAM: hypothetical protein O8I53_13870 [Campylobacter lari]